MAAQRLDAAARHLDRITRQLRGRSDPAGSRSTQSALALAHELHPHLAGLRNLELLLDQTAREDRAGMARLQLPSELRGRFDADERLIRQRVPGFRRAVSAVELALAANSEAQAQAALDGLAAELAKTDVTQRLAFDPDSLRAQQVKRETRRPAGTRAELQAFLAPTTESTATMAGEPVAASADAPSPELAQTEETRITPEIQALAAELGHNPVHIFNWVRNNIEFVPTHGAIQGAGLTLMNRRGNAGDTNSLLVALLRASGIPARFVYGTVDVPIVQAVNWLKAADVQGALGQIQLGGIPSTILTTNGQAVALRLQHLWVEAFIDFTPSRGAINRVPDAWIPMDASFKQHARTTSIDVLGLADWNPRTAAESMVDGAKFGADGSVTGLNTRRYHEYVQAAIARVERSGAGGEIRDPQAWMGQYSIVASRLPVITGTLPFAVSTATTRFAAIPASLKYYLHVQLFASQRDIAYENPALSLRVATVTLGGRSLYGHYKPATATDEYGLKSYETSNAASLPLSSFNVVPQVKLGDQVLAESGAVPMGTQQFWVAGIVDLQGHVSGAYEPAQFAAGSHISFTPNLGGMGEELLGINFNDLPDSSRQPVANALHLAGVQYWYLNDSRATLYARGWGAHFLRMPSVGVFAAPLQVRYFFGIPRTGSFAGFATDVKADRVALYHADPAKAAKLALQVGANGSLSESMTWDVLLNNRAGNSVSASSILAWANRTGVPIHTITASNLDAILPKLQTTSDVKNEIRSAVNAGFQVIIPEKEFTQGRLQAAGYVMIDPETGGGLYRVDGGLNGALNVGCLAKAVLVTVLCESRFARLMAMRLGAIAGNLAVRLGLVAVVAAVAPPLAIVLPVVSAVLLAVTIVQVTYEVVTWVREIVNGTISLTPEEMAEAGIRAVNEYACNYLPACFNNPVGHLASQALGSGLAPPDLSAAAAGGPQVGNPVSIGTGIKTQVEADYQGEGPFPLSYTRTYVSYLPNGSPVGHKWISNYHQRLRLPDGATAMAAPDVILAQRSDGGWQQYAYRSGAYVANGDVPERIERVTDGLGRTTEWRLQTGADTVERYSADGRLLSIQNRTGLRHTLGYTSEGLLERVSDDFGRSLRFEHDPQTRQVTALVDPQQRRTIYTYDAGALTTVRYPDQSSRQYHYETPGWPTLLTGITDERGIRYATWRYDEENRVVESSHADGADRVTLAYGDNQTVVTDARNTARTYRFTRIFDTLRLVEVSEPCASCGGGSVAKISYDGAGYPTLLADNNGNQTQVRINARGLPEQWTRALGKPEAQTVNVQWHPTWRVPTVVTETAATGIARTTRFEYDDRGNPSQRTVTVDGQSRTWSYAFNAAGQMTLEDGPRTDVQDITRYQYDAATGNRTAAIDANGHATRYTRHDPHGRVLRMVDANDLITDYRYDGRDRLVEAKVTLPGSAEAEVTGFRYTAYGALDRLTRPDGSWLQYSYDDAQRLTGIRDSSGNRIAYTLNAAGDREQEDTFDPAGALVMTSHRVIDALGRLAQAYGSNPAEATVYTYDDNGNERTALAPLHQNPTESRYDALNRLITTIDPMQGAVEYRYDAQDNLRRVIDPRGLATDYAYNGFDELETLTSPDTGLTRYTYDAAGNLASRRDARDVNASYGYDAGNRLASIVYPDETLAYAYDEAAGGAGARGRLTTLSDGSGRTRYVYDAQGRVLQKTQQLGADGNAAGRKTLSHSYADARIDATVLPSGARIGYRYGADGRVREISVNGVVLVREIDYLAFGEPRAWTTAAGRYARSFDRDGRIERHTRGANTTALRYDATSRIVEISEDAAARPHWQYGYDDNDRLDTAANVSTGGPLAGLALGWAYDPTGNRTRQDTTDGGTAATRQYAIDPASNRLAAIDGAARDYDATGNTTLANGQTLVYSGRGRLVEVKLGAISQARYRYNGLGERVCAATGAASCPTTSSAGSGYLQFVYDEQGHLIGEYDAAGTLIAEHVWLDDTPVAVLKPAAGAAQYGGSLAGDVAAYFVQPDHLDTPRTIVNAEGQELWRWDSAPFGDTAADENPGGRGSFAYRLRFPGQQYDAVTGTHYNYFRDYEPGSGRYVQSDPVGLDGGINTFTYVDSDPISYFDPTGERSRAGRAAAIQRTRNDPNTSKCVKGWFQQEENHIRRGGRGKPLTKYMRLPPGFDLAHLQDQAACNGCDYKNTILQNQQVHGIQTAAQRKFGRY
jgi:RHS repeat-associated protein